MSANGPKILTKTFSRKPTFFLDESDQLYCNGYGIFLKENLLTSCLSPQALAIILNSKIMHYFTILTSFQIAGGFQCYQKNFIESFGVPMLSADQVKTLVTLPKEEVDDWLCNLYGLSGTEIDEALN